MRDGKHSAARRVALELAMAILAEIDERAKLGITEPISLERQAHHVGMIAERHSLKPAHVEAMLRAMPWAMQATQTMADNLK
jgi:hypothetical protein